MRPDSGSCRVVADRASSDYERLSGSQGPLRWERVLARAAEGAGAKFEVASLGALFRSLQLRTIRMTWAPSLRILAWKAVGARVVFLHWGKGRRASAVKDALASLRLRAITLVADVVLANDHQSESEIRQLSKSARTQLIAYPVDVSHYRRRSQQGSVTHQWIVVGSNSRDECLVAELARRGIRIVRITQSEAAQVFLAKQQIQCLEVLFNVSEEKLAEYYGQAQGVLLPLLDIASAVGQHVLLEAIAAGKPIVATMNRISREFSGFHGVTLVNGSDPEEWCAAISRCRPLTESEEAENIAGLNARFGPDAVVKDLSRVFTNLCG